MSSSTNSNKAEYANQHYVPRLLLRRFTNSDKINIGLMNALSGEIKSSIPHKPQCAKRYFYGKDLVIEKKLAQIESEIGKIIESISSASDPHIERLSYAHKLLTIFSIYQHVRTDKALKLAEEAVEKKFAIIKEHVKPELMLKLGEVAKGKLSEGELSEFYDSVNVSIANPHTILFENANKQIDSSLQLEMKLLLNETDIPFIISDNPLVYMNEGDDANFYRMLLPLTPKVLLAFYDGSRYKIGLRKKNFHKIVEAVDVFYLNALQYLNCNNNIYFGPNTSTKHLVSLNSSFKKYRFNEAIELTKLNGQPFFKTNRPKVNYSFSFAKKIAIFSKVSD